MDRRLARRSPRPPRRAGPVGDTTGAGDAFTAGFLAAWLDGGAPARRSRRGTPWRRGALRVMLDDAMSLRVRDLLMKELGELRYEPIAKRIRGVLGGDAVVDSTRAMLVWEPGRVVPSYAVPPRTSTARWPRRRTTPPRPRTTLPRLGDRPIIDPQRPVRGPHDRRRGGAHPRARRPRGAGFRPDDPSSRGYVVLDFDDFDAWYEEDERNVSHPRDPFHRIDIVHSSRHVRVEVDGEVLAESSRPYLLFETPLPVRFYLPAEDVRTDLLTPSDTRTRVRLQGRGVVLVARRGRRRRLDVPPRRCARRPR